MLSGDAVGIPLTPPNVACLCLNGFVEGTFSHGETAMITQGVFTLVFVSFGLYQLQNDTFSSVCRQKVQVYVSSHCVFFTDQSQEGPPSD